jgi:hypothetical protein
MRDTVYCYPNTELCVLRITTGSIAHQFIQLDH